MEGNPVGKRNPKTQGTEWLYLSMASFNGSGYADKQTPQAYLDSYKFYKAWRKEKEAVELLAKHQIEALVYAESLVNANDAGHTPSKKNQDAFDAFVARARLLA